MSSKVTIFVEGTSDEFFLRKFIKFRYNIALKEKGEIGGIIELGGHGKKHLFEDKFKESAEDFGYTNLLFEDADSIKKGNRGFENVEKSLRVFSEKYKFQYFIFPNHENDGSLEDLLFDIINQPKKEWAACLQQYNACLAQKGYKANDKHDDWKQASRRFLKDENFDFEKDHWDVTEQNPHIAKLIAFLDKYFAKP